jgi:hypothetical protein
MSKIRVDRVKTIEKKIKKIDRLEKVVSASLQNIATDITSLQHNDTVLADAMDVNFTAIARILEKLGIPNQELNSVIEQVYAEKQPTEPELNEEEVKAQIDEVCEDGAEIPEEATTFGG